MGRGRQKAMAKKIVREVKYNTKDPDYEALVDELQTHEQESVEDMFHMEKDKHNDEDMTDEELQEYLEWAKGAAKPNGEEKEPGQE
jgi:hypothetical protein